MSGIKCWHICYPFLGPTNNTMTAFISQQVLKNVDNSIIVEQKVLQQMQLMSSPTKLKGNTPEYADCNVL